MPWALCEFVYPELSDVAVWPLALGQISENSGLTNLHVARGISHTLYNENCSSYETTFVNFVYVMHTNVHAGNKEEGHQPDM